jgi:hypothetical protein
MYTINSAALLKEAIFELEVKKTEQGLIIKEQFHEVKQQLRPANILRNTFDVVAGSPTLRSNLLGALVGLGAAYFSKRLVAGNSRNAFRKILGTALQLGISAVVAKKSGILLTLGQTIARRVFTKMNSHEPSIYQQN